MTAIFSPCRQYRYTLDRAWSRGTRLVLWVMLNPSTADDTKNDRTVARCIQFSKDWGYDGLMVGNMYAYRATKPADMWKAKSSGVDIVGPDNDRHIQAMAQSAELIVAAWGGHAEAIRAHQLRYMLSTIKPLYQLTETKDGQPCHPLYLPGSLKPIAVRM